MKIADLLETRKASYNFIKSILPSWPDYVLKDFLYANLARGATTGRDSDLQKNQDTARSKMFRYQYADQMNKIAASGKTGRQLPADYKLPFEPNTDLKGTLLAKKNQSDQPVQNDFTIKTIRQDIQTILDDLGLTADTKWQLVPNMKFTMDMWNPSTLKKLKDRAGGTKNPFEVPRDAERHATQAQLAQKQGGVRKEPVILIKRINGYELIEGWHRTIQHFKMYPDGYRGPAWVAKAQNVTEADKFEYTTEKQIITRIRQILYDRKLSGTESNTGELHMLRRKLKDIRSKEKVNEADLYEADEILTVMDKPVDVLINPGYQRMLGFAKKISYPILRALYVPSRDVVVVWPAEAGIHYQMAKALVDQLGWDLGSDLEHAMTHHRLTDPLHPQSAILRVEPPLVDSHGKIKKDTNIHKRAGEFSIVALPKFYNIDWWARIKRTAPPIQEAWTRKYKKSINCNNPKGFSQRAHCAGRKKRRAHGKTSSHAVSEDMNDGKRTLAANLVKLSAHINLIQMPTVQGSKTFIVDLDRRPVVLVSFSGHVIPFYCSTGQGGKANVASGKWYPFWGIGSDGWFNKGSEDMINNFYYSKRLANTAATLNQYLGNLVGNRDIPMAGASAVSAINQSQRPKSQLEARKDLIAYYAGITTQIRAIG